MDCFATNETRNMRAHNEISPSVSSLVPEGLYDDLHAFEPFAAPLPIQMPAPYFKFGTLARRIANG